MEQRNDNFYNSGRDPRESRENYFDNKNYTFNNVSLSLIA